MNKKEIDAYFDHVNQIFKEVDKTFKTMEEVMDKAYKEKMAEFRYPWKKWFAWRPVKVKGKVKWMRNVYRRPIPKTYASFDEWTHYEYGDIFDVLKDAGNGNS